MAQTKMPKPEDLRDELPANSNKLYKAPEETPKVDKKVISGTVVQKKKGWLDKATEAFFGEDANSVGSYILYDILLPAAKNTISDMVSGGIEMLLFGDVRSRGRGRDRDKGYVSYASYSSRNRDRDRDIRDRRPKDRHDFDDVIVETRQEADKVISSMIDLIEEYGSASVADFYEALGLDAEFTDNSYGWTNLTRADVRRVREGWSIAMPRPGPLD